MESPRESLQENSQSMTQSSKGKQVKFDSNVQGGSNGTQSEEEEESLERLETEKAAEMKENQKENK